MKHPPVLLHEREREGHAHCNAGTAHMRDSSVVPVEGRQSGFQGVGIKISESRETTSTHQTITERRDMCNERPSVTDMGWRDAVTAQLL
eukprot:CAMPEP_0117667570 /NCGR_PEP_ID=MMETSP0804-20121206/11046_1 /TAXON_ID=1074897 /ORGANISM="Tetraselmis astigmatica, Strain CCMP880" /LENGTH=88 /DNA_ID=CAMNT_0005475323 /DNA_START=654 /DNA_END=917 /DNA_ORIENTATION=+